MKKIVSKFELALSLASKRPDFLESHQLFERKEYLFLIKSFKNCKCNKLVQLYSRIFLDKFYNSYWKWETPLDSNESDDFLEFMNILGVKEVNPELIKSEWDKLPDGITKGLN